MSPHQLIKDTKQEGFWTAFRRFADRRHLPVVGYLILAGFTGYAFQQEREHSNQNRAAIAQQTHATLVTACERQNQLRHTLQGLVARGIPQTQQYVKDGTLTQAQADRAIAQSRDALKVLAPLNCNKVYSIK